MTTNKLQAFGENAEVKPAFGIDLGTTNSCISVLKSGKIPTIIPINGVKTTLPSCVMWKGGDKFIVGEEAYAKKYKSNVASSVKRIIGTNEKVVLEYGGKKLELTPEEISAKVLRELADRASKTYGKVEDVVITVPAYFNNSQIEATRKAGEIAGLNVLKTFREPTSAALTYLIDDLNKPEVTVLVYDLGGGTFDISLLRIAKTQDTSKIDELYGFDSDAVEDNSGAITLTVIKTDGDSKLGGDDIDNALLEIVMTKLKEAGYETKYIPVEQAKEIKHNLEQFKKNSNSIIEMPLDFKLNDKVGSHLKHVVRITPEDFYNATKVVYDKTKVCMDRALNGVALNTIDAILLVGGSTKSQLIKSFLAHDFGNVFISDALNPDESVSLGAAIEAKRVKYGDSNMCVYDVIPLSVGVYADGIVNKIIAKNQVVPCVASRWFATTVDDQEEISLDFYQGNSPLKEECTYIGTLPITGIPKKKAGEVTILVTMRINADGVLKCTAKIGEIVKSIELVNLFTGKDEAKINPSPKGNAKKLTRWRNLAKKLSEDNEKKLNEMLERYSTDGDNETEIVDFIRSAV